MEHGLDFPDTKRTQNCAEGHFSTIRGSGEPHTGELGQVHHTHKQRCVVKCTQQKRKSRGTATDTRAAERWELTSMSLGKEIGGIYPIVSPTLGQQ